VNLARFDAAASPIRKWLKDDAEGQRFLGTYLTDTWEHLVDFKVRFLWIAEDGGRQIGFFDFDLDPSGAGYFVFYVAPEFRGKGYGRRVLLAGMGTPEAKGCAHLEGGVEPDNTASRRVLEDEGFTNTGPDEDGMLMYRRER